MKILLLSCHAILEFDELKLFHELGLDVFSHGAYLRFNQPMEMRPAICAEDNTDEKILEQALNCTKENLPREFIDNFDIILVMHNPTWIINNWDKMSDKIVIWRTIGQSTSDVERSLAPYREKGLKIIRYSESERTLPNYIGEDAVIMFYKDANEFKDWNGNEKQIITVAQSMPSRATFCNYDMFLRATDRFQRKVFAVPGPITSEVSKGTLQLLREGATMVTSARDILDYYRARKRNFEIKPHILAQTP